MYAQSQCVVASAVRERAAKQGWDSLGRRGAEEGVRGIPVGAFQPDALPRRTRHSSPFTPSSDQCLVCIIFVCLLPLRHALCIVYRGQVVRVHFSCLLKETLGREA